MLSTKIKSIARRIPKLEMLAAHPNPEPWRGRGLRHRPPALIGPMLSPWFPVWKSAMSGMPRGSPVRFSTACCATGSCTISRSSGTSNGRCSPEPTTGSYEPCWYVRKINAAWYGQPGENSTIWASPSPKFIMGGSDETKFDHPTQKPIELMRRPTRARQRRSACGRRTASWDAAIRDSKTRTWMYGWPLWSERRKYSERSLAKMIYETRP